MSTQDWDPEEFDLATEVPPTSPVAGLEPPTDKVASTPLKSLATKQFPQDYVMEILLMMLFLVYLVNIWAGKRKNE